MALVEYQKKLPKPDRHGDIYAPDDIYGPRFGVCIEAQRAPTSGSSYAKSLASLHLGPRILGDDGTSLIISNNNWHIRIVQEKEDS